MSSTYTAILIEENRHGVEMRYAEASDVVWPGYHGTAPLGIPGVWIGTALRHTWVADTLTDGYAIWEESYLADQEEEEGQDDGPADTWQDEQAADFYEGSFEF